MKKLILLTILLVGLFSCNRNPLKIDISDVSIDLVINHFGVDLLEDTLTTDLSLRLPNLEEKYGDFLQIFTYHMIRIGGPDHEGYLEQFSGFVNDTTVRNLVVDVSNTIDTVVLRDELTDAFKHFKYYFPEKVVPAIFTCISGFNQSVVIGDSLIGISLDKYLGPDCPYYSMLGIEAYNRVNMHPEKIVSDVCYSWVKAEFPKTDKENSLISHMIYEGKLMYLVDAMLPEANDTLKIGYTSKQVDFCKNNEGAMWTYLAEHQLLFTSDRMNVKRFIDNAPFTNVFTNESPGRTGVWLGWQIVRSYMKKNPEVSLKALMQNPDCRSILSASGYQP